MDYYVCTNCGFWQRHFATPTRCPVCEDVRHTPPPDGYVFWSPAQADREATTVWSEYAPDVWMFRNEPAIGIGPSGYLIRHADGNIFFEGTGWYSRAALQFIAAQGNLRWLAASHPHAYGALWQLQERFTPVVAINVADLAWTNAFNVTWPWDERLELAPGITLHRTGGHFDGHAVLHHAPRRTIFAGDAVKFHFDVHPLGISCHKGFNRHIPLSHDEARRYHQVFAPLDFVQVFTAFEHARATTADVLHLFEAQRAGQPFCTPIAVESAKMRQDTRQ